MNAMKAKMLFVVLAAAPIALNADWYDSLHFNRFGAEKFSAVLAQRLLSLGVTPGGRGDEALWEARADYLLSK